MTLGFEALLVATLAIEVPFVCALAPPGKRRGVALTAFFMNLLTYTFGWAAVYYRHEQYIGTELVIVFFEALGFEYFGEVTWRCAVLLSVLANGATIALAFSIDVSG